MPNTSTNTLLTALKALLVADLPDLIAEVDGLPGIALYFEHEPVLKEMEKFPFVWVEWDRSRKNDDENRGRTIRHYSNDRVVQVGVAYKHANPQTCARNLRSYADLIRVCLEADMIASRTNTSTIVGPSGLNATWLLWLHTDPSPPLVDGSGVVLRQAVLSFDIPRIVNIGED